MNPISLNGGFYGSPYAGLRPEFPAPKPAGGAVDDLSSPLPSTGTQGPAAPSFGSMLGNFVKEVNTKQQVATDAVAGVLSGQNVPLHQAMIASEEAGVSFQLMVEVRNKLLEGYQDLMRLQV